MPENITLEQLQSAQNEYIAAQTAKINSLEANTAGALAALSELANRIYAYSHEALVTDSLDAVYDSIIEENPDLSELSAVGFTALLNDGDVIPTQDNIMFINGEQEENDYAFSGANSEGGTEFVSVWYFENDGALTADRVNANIAEISVKAKQTAPDFSTDFFDYADSVATNINLTAAPLAVKKQKNTLGGSFGDSVSSTMQEYENCCSVFGVNTTVSNRTYLKKVSFPNLTEILLNNTNNRTFLCDCSKCEEINIPNLEKIGGVSSGKSTTLPFCNVPYITVPESVKEIGYRSFGGNKTIILMCNEATNIHNDWCYTTPTELFSMRADWAASINIAIAAARWTKEQFIDLFQNRLCDLDDDVREIKIPTAIYDSMTDDEFALAEDKGWTVGA